MQVMRGAKRKGTRYFGPYAHAWAIRETVDLLLRVFPVRTCSSGVFRRAGQVGRPCLLGYIGKCSAPCVGPGHARGAPALAEDFCDFMAGNTGRFVRRLEARDARGVVRAGVRAGGPAARRHRRAQPRPGEERRRAGRRDRRRRVRPGRGRARGRRPGLPRPRRPDPRPARLGGREGRGRRHRTTSSSTSCSRSTASRRRRCRARCWSRRCPATPHEVAAWLEGLRGARVDLRVPQRGDKRALLETVERNAGQALNLHKTRRGGDLTTRSVALKELQEALDLPDAPLRIECYDVSNLQGTEVVASMVVFEDGLPRKSEYRRFSVRGTRGPGRHRVDERGDHPAVPPLPGRARRGQRRRDRPGHRPRDRQADEVRLPTPARRRGRRPAAGGRRRPGAGRPRHRRGVPGRAGQAARGGLAARATTTRSSCRAAARACTCCSGCATRRTGSRSPTTASAGPGR